MSENSGDEATPGSPRVVTIPTATSDLQDLNGQCFDATIDANPYRLEDGGEPRVVLQGTGFFLELSPRTALELSRRLSRAAHFESRKLAHHQLGTEMKQTALVCTACAWVLRNAVCDPDCPTCGNRLLLLEGTRDEVDQYLQKMGIEAAPPDPPSSAFPPCLVCGGKGKIPINRMKPAPEGEPTLEECGHCGGSGEEPLPEAIDALRAGISSGKTMMMAEKHLPQGETEYVVHWEICWRNLGMSTVQSDEADDLEDAHSIADRLKETRLTLEAADPKGEDVATPSIDRIWITFLSTREIEVE